MLYTKRIHTVLTYFVAVNLRSLVLMRLISLSLPFTITIYHLFDIFTSKDNKTVNKNIAKFDWSINLVTND